MDYIMNFGTVLVVTACVACTISTLYAFGLRLWFKGASKETTDGSHITLRLAGGVCFAACVVIVLFALWLMIPLFH